MVNNEVQDKKVKKKIKKRSDLDKNQWSNNEKTNQEYGPNCGSKTMTRLKIVNMSWHTIYSLIQNL